MWLCFSSFIPSICLPPSLSYPVLFLILPMILFPFIHLFHLFFSPSLSLLSCFIYFFLHISLVFPFFSPRLIYCLFSRFFSYFNFLVHLFTGFSNIIPFPIRQSFSCHWFPCIHDRRSLHSVIHCIIVLFPFFIAYFFAYPYILVYLFIYLLLPPQILFLSSSVNLLSCHCCSCSSQSSLIYLLCQCIIPFI